MISATETKLIPRQSPQRPPKPEMKSNQVIFGNLSYSENMMTLTKDIYGLTICSRLSKEDVHNCDVLFVSVVIGHVLKKLIHL